MGEVETLPQATGQEMSILQRQITSSFEYDFLILTVVQTQCRNLVVLKGHENAGQNKMSRGSSRYLGSAL